VRLEVGADLKPGAFQESRSTTSHRRGLIRTLTTHCHDVSVGPTRRKFARMAAVPTPPNFRKSETQAWHVPLGKSAVLRALELRAPMRCVCLLAHGETIYSRLDQIIDMNHPLAKLARTVDWRFLQERFGEVYTDVGVEQNFAREFRYDGIENYSRL